MTTIDRIYATALAAVLAAYSAGKQLQFRHAYNQSWIDVPEGEHMQLSQLDRYRIKPEAKLRPWKPREVPIGAVVRPLDKRHVGLYLIGSVKTGKADTEDAGEALVWLFGHNVEQCGRTLLNNFEWQWPAQIHAFGGNPPAWNPCGVEES